MRDSLIVFVFFAVGVALGYADAVPTWLLDPDLPMIILSVMVVLVGLGLGAGEDCTIRCARSTGGCSCCRFVRSSAPCSFRRSGVLVLRGFSLTDCLAVGAVSATIRFRSVLIADLKSATLGVQGAARVGDGRFAANVVREMIALFGMPLFARWAVRWPRSRWRA